ncbi:hypothetical protein Cch01nite_14060 [Cellulomonas chitinilytica]|uniref:Peptidoglycan binding-like domain-containing protein n=1 Tax=Cellulomonas chitinilytica TaxID=398759 RepID=A0A919NZY6_9CELL|nr:peptidoglycan-binding domain-containing protein [Cellulomonas chitinilytica]GIG20682.1 hypothetical protein Cch01nite_14060 [Cellulomonas chitinilytica]
MQLRRRRSVAGRIVATITLMVAMVAGTSVAANAYSASYSDFRGLPTLGTAYVKQGNVVGLWQNILFRDGYINKCTSLSAVAIDGYFGSGTAAATKRWQANHGLAADGIVGKASWAAASTRLRGPSFYEWDASSELWGYEGAGGWFDLVRRPADSLSLPHDSWTFVSLSNPNGGDKEIIWPSITFRTC